VKKRQYFIIFGFLFLTFSGALEAQGFGGGGYTGPSLEPITIADLAGASANEYVIVSGILVRQNMPGRFVLVDREIGSAVSVRIGAYEWANLEVDGETPILVYGVVLKSAFGLEIIAERIEFFPADQEENKNAEKPRSLMRGFSLLIKEKNIGG
jgi:uncharacterized protein YdeI (BOF family)